jgi:hypothetical protein
MVLHLDNKGKGDPRIPEDMEIGRLYKPRVYLLVIKENSSNRTEAS